MPPLTGSQLAARREQARRRAARRRMAVAGLALGAVAIVVAAIALATGGGGGPPRPPAQQAGTSAPSATAPGATRTAANASRTTPRLPPIAPAVPGTAKLILQGPRKPEIALTFDDGFCKECVARIIQTLARTGAHASIFPNGVYSSSWNPQAATIRRLVARGQLTVGNHTFLHHDALLESSAAFASDLQNDEAWIERTFGVSARPFFRPPYGAHNATTLQVAGRHGYTKVINWSGTVADSSPRTIGYILGAIRYWAHPGAIILMHGNYPNTSIALPQILAILKSRGLRPVTLAELLG
jgi:peptidoglycan/xylan/chitin deacetylase (PgdA/CDA1 family)